MLFLLPLFSSETYLNDPTFEDQLEIYVWLWNKFGPTN